MREVREFRAHHPEYVAAGVGLVGICRDSVETNRRWTDRLRLPYPILSDREGEVSRRLGILKPLKLAAWTIELMRRSTLLADVEGRIVATWGEVHIRGHAVEVLELAKALPGKESGTSST